MFGLPDTYTVKARIFPALLAALPALALASVMVSWRELGISHVIAGCAAMMLLYAFSDLARRLGKNKERGLFGKMGGKPSTTMLRHRDGRFDASAKASWCHFVGGRLKEKPPTVEAESADPDAADAFYERCGDWLREHTRDHKRFKLIFEELVTYGFRRNLLGLKWPALALNAVVVSTCIAAVCFRLPFSLDDHVSVRLAYVLIASTCHALYFTLAVDEKGSMQAANQYGRQLLLGCETLMAPSAPPSRGKKVIDKEATEAVS